MPIISLNDISTSSFLGIFNANWTMSVVNRTLSGNIATVGSDGNAGTAIYNLAGVTLTIIGGSLSNIAGLAGRSRLEP